MTLDKCQSQNVVLPNYKQMQADPQQSDDVRLSLGGIPPLISTNHFYYSILNVFEYEGCIRNLRVNGDLRNLKLSSNQNDYNLAREDCDCKYQIKCTTPDRQALIRSNEFPWWIILIILGALLLLGKLSDLKRSTFFLDSFSFKQKNKKEDFPHKKSILIIIIIKKLKFICSSSKYHSSFSDNRSQ